MPPDDMFAAEEMTDDPEAMGEPAPADGLELGAGDESELDPLFAADAQAIFPDFDDDQLLALQRLFDSRAASMSASPEPMMEEGPLSMDAEPLAEGDLGL